MLINENIKKDLAQYFIENNITDTKKCIEELKSLITPNIMKSQGLSEDDSDLAFAWVALQMKKGNTITYNPFAGLPSINIYDNICILTHTDLDGAGAPIILSLLYVKKPRIIHCSNKSMSRIIRDMVVNNPDNFDAIYAVDISCTEEDAIAIDAAPMSKHFTLIDHHETAMYLNKYSWAHVQDDIPAISSRNKEYPNHNGHSSGTSLLFDYMQSCDMFRNSDFDVEKLYKLVHLIAAYDTWDWQNVYNSWIDPVRLNTLCREYSIERFETEMIKRIKTNGILFNEADELLLSIAADKTETYVKRIKSYVRTGEITLFGNHYTLAYVFATNYYSDVFRMMEEFNCDINIINFGTSLSFRTRNKDINIAHITKVFGGGGHRAAGGVPIPDDKIMSLVCDTLKGAEIKFDEDPNVYKGKCYERIG